MSFPTTAILRLTRKWISTSTWTQCSVAQTLTAIAALLVMRHVVLFGTGTGFFRPRRTRQLVLNHSYVLDARHACRMPQSSTQGPDLVILICTTADRREQRDAIRETYGSLARGEAWPGYGRETADRSGVNDLVAAGGREKAEESVREEGRRRKSGDAPTLRLVFLLGQAKTPSLRLREFPALQQESARFGDLVQWEGLEEDYFNLTYKVLLGLRWVRHFCSSARLVGKVDDNTFIHVPRLFTFLPISPVSSSPTPQRKSRVSAEGISVGRNSNSVGTAAGGLKTDRNILSDDENTIYGDVCKRCRTEREGKYAVSYTMFPFAFFPTYAGGNLYFMSTSLAFRTLSFSEYFPYHSMEDVFVTGILGYAVGARHHRFTSAQYNPRTMAHRLNFQFEEKIATNDVSPHEFRAIWKTMTNHSLIAGHSRSHLGLHEG